MTRNYYRELADILSNIYSKVQPPKFKVYKSGDEAAGKQSDEDRTWFCSAYQRNKCIKKTNNLDTINGRMRIQSHICATCWLKDKVKLEHQECSLVGTCFPKVCSYESISLIKLKMPNSEK